MKDTFELVDTLREFNIADAHLASMDVVSLFTNVHVDETINSICEHIQANNLDLGLPHGDVKQLFEICTKNVTFRFQGHYFRQVDGAAMGSPLGPLMADVFMATLEAKHPRELSQAIMYRRYVDDTMVITSTKEEAVDLLDKMNELHPDINLTIEHESDGTLPFLDVLIKRESTEAFNVRFFVRELGLVNTKTSTVLFRCNSNAT